VNTPTGVHHVTLTVQDVDRSAEWYQRVLGPADAARRSGDGWERIRLAWPTGLVIGVTKHESAGPHDHFDERRMGLDHIGLTCTSEDEVRDWAARLDDLGVAHGPVEVAPYGWAVTARDPDGIAIEFFCAKA
jgi:catechol 2,3-dioxygenase-like lactoylglutathione lyase family enzyme